jgi:sulfite reductase beta subunit-like hemoprotein
MSSRAEKNRRTSDFDVLARIAHYAQTGAALSTDDEARFRRYGIYTQRPKEDGFFMVRTRIPGGDLTPEKLRLIAALSKTYGRGLADITVRQNIQYHWVRIENLGVILERLREVGLSTTEAVGDSVRNILNCPASGVDHEELFDTTPLIKQVNDFFTANESFADLPRKFKIAITGCAQRCVYPEVNDIGLFAVRDDEGGVAFRARVGGGLSTAPRFSKDLGILVAPAEVAKLCAAIATVFRQESYRRERQPTGANYVLEPWEIPRFREAVEALLGRPLRRAAQAEAEPITRRDRSHIGIHRQRQAGFYYIGLAILGGRTTAAQLHHLADLAETYGSGRIRTTNTQNIMLLDIPEQNVQTLTKELDAAGLDYHPNWARQGMLACTGKEFCKLALTETKNRARELDTYLSEALDLDEAVRISVTGCPNSCGQHAICDVGLEGSLVTINGAKREAFQVFLGGGVGLRESIARRIGVRIASEDLSESLARLFRRYKEARLDQETFQEFCLRHTDDELASYLAPPLTLTAHHASQTSLNHG